MKLVILFLTCMTKIFVKNSEADIDILESTLVLK